VALCETASAAAATEKNIATLSMEKNIVLNFDAEFIIIPP